MWFLRTRFVTLPIAEFDPPMCFELCCAMHPALCVRKHTSDLIRVAATRKVDLEEKGEAARQLRCAALLRSEAAHSEMTKVPDCLTFRRDYRLRACCQRSRRCSSSAFATRRL